MQIYLAVAVAIAGCTQHSTRDEPKSGAFEPADTVHRAEDALNIAVHRRDVPLEEMPIIPQTLLGLPMSGRGNVAIDLNVPAVHGQSHYRRAAGTIALACPAGCTLGDDHSPLTGGAVGPLDFGHIAFDSVDIRAEVHDGRAQITKWDVKSKDVELHARMKIDLDDTNLDASAIDGCVQFKATPTLLAAQPKTAAVIMTTGASPNRDGLYSIRISGTLGATKRLAQECGAG